MAAVCSTTFAGSVITNDCFTTAASLPAASIGSAYSQTLVASGLVAPLTFALISGALPTGLSLNEITGEIYGTPTTEQLATFRIEVSDTNGVYCVRTFTLNVTPVTVNCGWWNEIIYVKDPSPLCSPTTAPTDLTGTTFFALSVPLTIPDNGCYLRIDGTKTYTGPEVVLKLEANVTALGPDFGGGLVVVSVYDVANAVYLINATITVIGNYVYSATVPASVAGDFEIHFEGINGVEAAFTMTACESTVTGSGWQLEPASPMFYYAPAGMNPAATITIASNHPITWTLNNNFNMLIWASPPTITLDGVPQTFYDDGINWYLDLATVDTDACVVKTFAISGGTLADSTGLGAFQPVPDVT